MRKILDDNTISCEQFLRVHCCVEELFRRLLLIGLRLKGVQYNDAVTISEIYYESMNDKFIKKVIEYCGLNYNKLIDFGNYKTFQALFLEFAKPHRNKLVHGLALNYSDNELLELLISIDKCLIQELEAFFNQENKLSFFDPPKKWGAKRIAKKADIKKIYKELLGRNLLPPSVHNKKSVANIMKEMKRG